MTRSDRFLDAVRAFETWRFAQRAIPAGPFSQHHNTKEGAPMEAITFDDNVAKFFGELCDIYERNVWGPYDPDDGFLHTSDGARAFARDVCLVFAHLHETYGGGDTSDAHLDDLIYGVRHAFDDAVIAARMVVAAHDCQHQPGRCHIAEGFQPFENPDFEPCATYGGDSVRANEVAWTVAGLLGWHRVAHAGRDFIDARGADHAAP